MKSISTEYQSTKEKGMVMMERLMKRFRIHPTMPDHETYREYLPVKINVKRVLKATRSNPGTEQTLFVASPSIPLFDDHSFVTSMYRCFAYWCGWRAFACQALPYFFALHMTSSPKSEVENRPEHQHSNEKMGESIYERTR